MPARDANPRSDGRTPSVSMWETHITRRHGRPTRRRASTRTSRLGWQALNLPGAQQLPEASGMLSVNALVALLFGSCRPSAIRRLIVSVVVDSVNRVVGRWATAHVGKKRFVGVPAFTDGDATVGVILPLSEARPAPLTHRGPRLKLWRPLAACRLAVRSQNLAHAFALQASAALRVSGPEASASDRCLFATIAPAQPAPSGSGGMWCAFNDRQAPESIALV